MNFCHVCEDYCDGNYPEGAPVPDECVACVERIRRMHRNCQRAFNLIATIFSIVAVQQILADLLGR